MMSFPSPTWCMSALSPFCRAVFFCWMISVERFCMVSEIARRRRTWGNGTASLSTRRMSHFGMWLARVMTKRLSKGTWLITGLLTFRCSTTLVQEEKTRDVQERLEGLSVGIRRVLRKLIKRVPEACLAEHLQGCTRHPPVHIQVLGLSPDAVSDRLLQLVAASSKKFLIGAR